MTHQGWMPSRELGERYAEPARRSAAIPPVDMPPHVVEAAAAGGAPAGVRADARAARAAGGDRRARLGASSSVRSTPTGRCWSRSAGCRGCTSRRRSSARARSATRRRSSSRRSSRRSAAAAAARAATTGRPTGRSSRRAVDGETTLAIVNTPVNPTGYVLRPADLDAIAAALRASHATRCSSPTRRTRACSTTATATSPPRRIRTSPAGRSSCGASRRRTGWPRGGSATPSARRRRSTRSRGRSRWQSLAIDGVAQAAALAALTGPQDWIEAAIAELAERAAARDRGGERDRRAAGRASRGRGVRLGGGRRRRGRVERPPRRRLRHPGARRAATSAPERRTCGSRSAAAARRARRWSSGCVRSQRRCPRSSNIGSGQHGQHDVRRIRASCAARSGARPPSASRCRRPRRCSGCARSAGSSSSSRRAAPGGPRLNTFAIG